MKNLRRYGKEPFSVAVIHGGPGGGVLEPLTTVVCLEGQVEELDTVLREEAELLVRYLSERMGTGRRPEKQRATPETRPENSVSRGRHPRRLRSLSCPGESETPFPVL